MKRPLYIIAIFVTMIGCYNHKVDTFEKWCEQINGVNLERKYNPFYSVVFSVSFDGDSIRNDFTAFMNKSHMEKVNNRIDKMAWRDGTDLHLVNLSSLMMIEPEEVISGWRKGIETAKISKLTDKADTCLYGTLVSMFDRLIIHSMKADALGRNWTDNITVIETDRETRLGKNRL